MRKLFIVPLLLISCVVLAQVEKPSSLSIIPKPVSIVEKNTKPYKLTNQTAWMLMLAAARWLGMEINLAAKVMCATFGAATVWLTVRSPSGP